MRHASITKIAAVLGLVFTLASTLPSVGQGKSGTAGILPPHSRYHGLTYAEWSVKWWQWVFSLPTTNSPILDTAPAETGQSGPVWFLTGAFVATTTTRTCVVPAGKALLVPIANAWADNTWCPQFGTATADELKATAAGYVDNAGQLACWIDGVPVPDLSPTCEYRVGAQVFSYTLAPTDNILANYFGPLVKWDLSCLTDGMKVKPAAEDGVYLLLAPLPIGEHSIHFTVEGGGLDITYQLIVTK